jgi:hypothetical protein
MGLSIRVALVFAVSLFFLILASLVKKWYHDLRFLIMVGLVAALLSAPYLRDLNNANQLSAAPIAFGVRNFGPANRLVSSLDIDHSWMWLLNLLLLPVNFLIEFGFFGVAAILYWKNRLKSRVNLERDDVFNLALFSGSILVCTFFRSSIQNNDLGWRGLMVGQFVLLVWSADFVVGVIDRFVGKGHTLRGRFASLLPWRLSGGGRLKLARDYRVYTILFLLLLGGGMATMYDLLSIRSYAVLKSRFDDSQFAERFCAMREAYQWLNSNLPNTAIVQHNPDVGKDFFHELYGSHRVIVSDRYFGKLLGVRENFFNPFASSMTALFLNTDEDNLVGLEGICQDFSISTLVVKDTDPVWDDSQSWVWKREPLFSNEFARVYACDSLAE